jgi:CubicO group peptidase (beta-lactamase class C family)
MSSSSNGCASNGHASPLARRSFLKAAAGSAALAVPAALVAQSEVVTPAGPEGEGDFAHQALAHQAPTGSAGFDKARLDRVHQVMSGHVERGNVPGLVTLVSRGGEVHAEALGVTAYGGRKPMRRDTIFRIASMTKPITAAAAMILVEECRLRLDDPVDEYLPELATRRVLNRLESPLTDTVPANRPISLRDLLTFRLGHGFIMAMPGTYPIQAEQAKLGLAPSAELPSVPPDEWLTRLGSLPLVHQPGERWLYHTGSDVLGVLIARASGKSLEQFLRERIFDPLGMKDTGFHVPASKLDRLPDCYFTHPETGKLETFDSARNSRFSRPPVFQAGGGGLVSTVDDYHAFCRMLLGMGQHGGEQILSRPSVELMTTNQLTAEQKAGSFLPESRGWGLGLSVVTRRDDICEVPGRFGWDGGYGTSAYTDPANGLIGIQLTQKLWTSPSPPPVQRDFWTSVYQAIDA